MDEHPDLEALIPPESERRPAARARLVHAIQRDRGRRRRRRFGVRAAAAGLVLFVAWSAVPQATNEEALPLIGLAEAVARLPAPAIEPDDLWYIKAERRQRISLAPAPSSESVTVVLASVEETWLGADASGVQRTTYSHVEFLDPGDRTRFEHLDLGGTLPVGEVAEQPVRSVFSSLDPVWREGYEAFYAELQHQAGSSGNVVVDRLAMLRLAAATVQHHGGDPAKRSLVLRTIAEIPGTDVERIEDRVAVSYDFVSDDIAQQITLEFDAATGELKRETISSHATPTSPAVILSEASYQTGPAFNIEIRP